MLWRRFIAARALKAQGIRPPGQPQRETAGRGAAIFVLPKAEVDWPKAVVDHIAADSGCGLDPAGSFEQLIARRSDAAGEGRQISIGVAMKHRGADNGRTAPELIMGGREQRLPEEIGEALRASVLGVRS
jgi:hypothetical protein